MALWDQITKDWRKEICVLFYLNKKMADKKWEEIDEWIRVMIQEYFDKHNCDYMKMKQYR